MSDRRVKVTFEANVGGYKKGMEEAASATEKLADSAEAAAKSSDKQKAALKTLAPAAMVAGAGLAAGVGMAVKKYADFDKAMSGVQAATHESTANMALMREEAIRAGADTAFSASEAAQGIEELAKAGVTTAEIMGGGLTGALDLAAAGELGVGDAAEIASSAMTQFKLGGDQVVHLADLLAAGAGKAQGGVQDLGAALGQAGLVASSTGLSIEETIGGLTAFASAGLMGSDAGTSFKSMLQRLTPQSKEAQRTFDELGISAYDANGEFIGLAEFAGVLKTQMADLTPEARNAAMGVMFGSDAVRASTILYEQGAEGIKDWIGQVDDAGYAAKTASIMQNNLAGDIEKLGGAFDTVFIQSGGVGNDMLRGLVQSAESVVDAFGKIPAPVLGVGTVLAGVAGGGLLLGGALITTIPKIKDTVDALRDVIPAGGKADKALRGVGKGAAYAGAAIGALSIIGPTIASWVDSGLKADPSKLAAELRNVGSGGKEAELGLAGLEAIFNTGGKDFFSGLDVGGLEDAFRVIGNPSISDNVDNTLSSILSFGQRGSSNIEFAKKNFSELDTQLSSMVSNGMADQAGIAYETLAQKALDAGVPIEKLVEIFPGYNSALAQNSTAASAAVGANEETASALEEVGLAADGAIESMDKFLESLFALGNVNMSVRDAAINYQESLEGIAEAQKEIAKGKMGKTLNKAKDDFEVTTKAGKLANAEFQGLAKSGMAEVEAMAAKGLGQDELQAKLNTTYKDLVKAGEGFGLSKKAATDLTREVLGVPEGVDIKTWIDDAAKSGAEEIATAVNAIPEMKNVKVIITDDGTVAVTDEQIQSIKDRTISTTVTDEGTILEVQGGINNVEGKTEHILVNDDGTVQVVQTKINKTTGKTEYIRVTDNGTVAGVQNKINTVRDGSATINVSWNIPARPSVMNTKQQMFNPGGSKDGGQLPKNAAGSKLPRTGPGNDRRDGFLGVKRDGTPLSWLDGGEWIINRESSDKHDELADMINRDDPRLGMLKQLMGIGGLAKGGRVGAAEKKVKSTKRAYDLIDGKKANRLRKLAAKDQWEAAKDELASVKKSSKASADAAKKAEAARKKAAQEEREKQSRLSEGRFDLRTEARRGTMLDAFTSGGGMGYVDKMFDASNNKDLSKKQRANMRSLGYKTERELLKLEKRAESVEKKIDKATAARDRLLSARDGASDKVTGAFDLGSMLGQKDDFGYSKHVGKKGLLSYGKSLAAGAKTLSVKVKSLQKLGFNESMIDQVIDEWTNAGTFELANAMLSMNKAERGQFNKSFKDLGTYATRTGNSLTEAMAKGGLNAAQSLVDKLGKEEKNVEKAFYNLGKAGQKGFHRAWGIASPAKEAKKDVGHIIDGQVLAIKDQGHRFTDAMAGLYASPAFSIPPSSEVSRYAAQPAAGSTVSLSPADRQLMQDFIVASQNMPPMQLQIDRRQAGTLVHAGQKFNGTHS